jgi:hypothetical protein
MNQNNPALSINWRLKLYFSLLLFLVVTLLLGATGVTFLCISIIEKSVGIFTMGIFVSIITIAIFVRGVLAEHRMFRNMGVTPLTSEQQFALAVSAILTESNKHRHDSIHCDRPSVLLKTSTLWLLRGSWNIKNSRQLIETLQWLSEGGHRAEYEAMYNAISNAWPISDALQLLDVNDVKKMKSADRKEIQRQFACIVKYRTQYSSILAWDLCRLVSVARWGVGVEYITEDEAWTWILDAAQRLKSEFGSWKELGENYLLGRNFMGFTDSKPEKSYKKLIKGNNSSSPWNRIQWIPAAD